MNNKWKDYCETNNETILATLKHVARIRKRKNMPYAVRLSITFARNILYNSQDEKLQKLVHLYDEKD